MKSTHPLELPEIISHCARFIPERSLPVCARVSKAWYRVFVQLIWDHVWLNTDAPSLLESIWRHAHLITKLDVADLPEEHVALRCSNLKTLAIGTGGHPDFILNHSSISVLTLRFELTLGPDTWDKLHGFRDLRKLNLYDMFIKAEEEVDALWRLCTRLEQVYFSNLTMAGRGSLSSMLFPHIKEAELWNFKETEDISLIPDFLYNCPGLSACLWAANPMVDLVAMPRFLQLLAEKTWSKLHILRVLYYSFPESDLPKILENMQQITCLDLLCPPSYFKPGSMDLLRQHFANLVELSLNWPDDAKASPMPQEVLSSCPMLERLHITRVDAATIAEGGPWVCLGLKSLNMSIKFDPLTNHLVQPRVFDQLSRLERLQTLCLWKYERWNTTARFQEAVDMRLESCLGRLAALRGLRNVDWGMSRQRMGEQEVNWMLEHWKNLEQVVGMLNESEPEVDRVQRGRLRTHGIRSLG